MLCLNLKWTFVPDDGVFSERTRYVHFPHRADCADSYSGRRVADLGSQSQLGLRAKRGLGPGGAGADCVALDGPNLTRRAPQLISY